MRAALGLACALACAACGGESPDRTEPTPTAPTPTLDPARRTPEPVAPEPLLTELGWATPPPVPTPPQRAANRRGLRHHRAGRFDDSRAAFAGVVADAPGYRNARFNLACAMAKLGDFPAAVGELHRLLQEDLPEYGPRIDTDDDLAALRAAPEGAELQRWRARVTRSYEAALEAGAPVVWQQTMRNPEADDLDADPDWAERLYAQAGVWWPAERRFVPMGPRAHANSSELEYGHAAVWVHAPRRTVINVTATSNAADMSTLFPVIEVYRAPTGERLHRRVVPYDEEWTVGWVSIRPTPEGAHYDKDNGGGFVGPRGEPEGPTMRLQAEADSDIEFHPTPPRGAQVEGLQLTLGEGEAARRVQLPRPAPIDAGDPTRSTLLTELGASHLLAVTTVFVDMGLDGAGPGPHVVSRIERRTGNIERLQVGTGAAPVVAYGAGALVQADGVLYAVEARGPATELPAGLVLAPTTIRW